MSILIEGIELPKENQRGLWVVIHADGTVEYASGDEGWKTLKQAAYPVPPHGRLIDADALLKKIRCRSLDEHGEYLLWYVGEDDIKNAPTIIPPRGGKEDE